MPKTQKRSVVFPVDTLEQIEKLAVKRNLFAADIIREFVHKGLSVTGHQDNIDFITNIIRQEVKVEIKKQADRLAAMLFKVGAVSSSNYFLAVRMLSDIISPSMQADFKDINSTARQLGIDYMKLKGIDIVDFLEDDDKVEEAAAKLKQDLFMD